MATAFGFWYIQLQDTVLLPLLHKRARPFPMSDRIQLYLSNLLLSVEQQPLNYWNVYHFRIFPPASQYHKQFDRGVGWWVTIKWCSGQIHDKQLNDINWNLWSLYHKSMLRHVAGPCSYLRQIVTERPPNYSHEEWPQQNRLLKC